MVSRQGSNLDLKHSEPYANINIIEVLRSLATSLCNFLSKQEKKSKSLQLAIPSCFPFSPPSLLRTLVICPTEFLILQLKLQSPNSQPERNKKNLQ